MKQHAWGYLLAFVLIPITSPAEESSGVIPIFVSTKCNDDQVGQRIAYKIREGIRDSKTMSVADTYADAAAEISIVCLNNEANGHVSRYSYAITGKSSDTYYDLLLTHGIGACGSDRVDECAEGLVADIDERLSEVRARIKSGTFRLRSPNK